jgi:hypothetical protein
MHDLNAGLHHARNVSRCLAREWCLLGLSVACFVAVASIEIVVGVSLLRGNHDTGMEAKKSRAAIAFLAISVSAPVSPSIEDRQGFQNRVSQIMAAPARNRTKPMQVRRSSRSVVDALTLEASFGDEASAVPSNMAVLITLDLEHPL